MKVETNFGIREENNIFRPICLTSRPGTHVHLLLMHGKLPAAIFQGVATYLRHTLHFNFPIDLF